MSTVTDQLAALGTETPPGFTEQVLMATGTGRFYDRIDSPAGDVLVGWSAQGIYGVTPAFDEERFFEENTIHGVKPILTDMPARLRKRVERAVESGKLGTLEVDLGRLSDFQQAVLRKTAEIPPGELRPYGWIAREIGKPGATRAVGSALNKNPVPILIPCHRVGKSDGTVGQYAYGSAMKRTLLAHEGLDPDEVDAVAERGVRYVGSATTNIYCHPTCHNARRIKEANRVELRNASAATNQGFRACKVCRPAVAA